MDSCTNKNCSCYECDCRRNICGELRTVCTPIERSRTPGNSNTVLTGSIPSAPMKKTFLSPVSRLSKGIALDFAAAASDDVVQDENAASEREHGRRKEKKKATQGLPPKTPGKQILTPTASMPIIYGDNVTLASPDPFSKFHEGEGPKELDPITPAKYLSSAICDNKIGGQLIFMPNLNCDEKGK